MLSLYANPRTRLDALLRDGNTVAAYRAGYQITGSSAASAWASYIGSQTYTNLCLYSQGFDNATSGATWNEVNGLTVSADATTAPDGTVTADKLNAANSTTSFRIAQSITVVSGTVYTLSAYLKAAELSYAVLDGGFTNAYAFFNLSNGTTGTRGAGAISSGIESAGNGFYRCWVTFSATSTSGGALIWLAEADNNFTVTGTGSNGIYAWGAQLVADFIPLAYVATTGSTANGTKTGPTLGQATGAAQPTINADGSLTFDGANHYMREATSSATQPYTIYAVLKSPTVVDGDWVFTSGDGGATGLRQKNTQAYMTQAGSAVMTPDASLAVDTYGVFTMVFNGASSTLQINGGSVTTANIGANGMTGFTIGGIGTTPSANVAFKEIIRRSGADTAATQARIAYALKQIYGTP